MDKVPRYSFSLKKIFSRFSLPSFLQPPSFVDEFKDQYIQAVWYTFSVGLAVCTYMTIFFAITQDWIYSIFGSTIIVVVLIALLLIKKGFVHLSVSIVLGLVYFAVFGGVLFGDGLNDIGLQSMYPIMFIIGAFMHRRSTLVFGSLTILWIILLIYLDTTGFYLDKGVRFDPLTKGFITLGVFVLTALIMRYIMQQTLLVNRDLNLARKEAEQASRLKSLFLANMSHELRTPLNAIIGYSEGILEEHEMNPMLDNLTAEDIQRIQLSGKHLLTLINDILDLSKIEADKMVVSLESFSLSQLVYEVVNLVQPTAEKNNTAVKVSNNFQGINLTSDRQKIKQILLNLLSNGAKYTQNGEVSIRVSIFEPGVIKISVADTGIGIAKEDLPHIFDSFRQVDSSLSRSFNGTGLGLTITKKIVEILDGNLLVESEKGKGSVFTLILPIEPINKSKLISIGSTYKSKIFEPSV